MVCPFAIAFRQNVVATETVHWCFTWCYIIRVFRNRPSILGNWCLTHARDQITTDCRDELLPAGTNSECGRPKCTTPVHCVWLAPMAGEKPVTVASPYFGLKRSMLTVDSVVSICFDGFTMKRYHTEWTFVSWHIGFCRVVPFQLKALFQCTRVNYVNMLICSISQGCMSEMFSGRLDFVLKSSSVVKRCTFILDWFSCSVKPMLMFQTRENLCWRLHLFHTVALSYVDYDNVGKSSAVIIQPREESTARGSTQDL